MERETRQGDEKNEINQDKHSRKRQKKRSKDPFEGSLRIPQQKIKKYARGEAIGKVSHSILSTFTLRDWLDWTEERRRGWYSMCDL